MANNIEYKFLKIDLTQFSPAEENYDSDNAKVGISTEFGFAYNRKDNVLRCSTILRFVQNELTFLRCELQAFFLLKEESIQSLIINDELIIPKGLLCQFASLCYGSFRGVLYVKMINTPFSDIILPPLYIDQVIKEDLKIALKL